MRSFDRIILTPLLLALGCAQPSGLEGDDLGHTSLAPPTPEPPALAPFDAPLDGPLQPDLHPPQSWKVTEDGSGASLDLPTALAQAEAGDILLLAPGRYAGPIQITQPLTLMRDLDAPSGEVLIDGKGHNATITIYGARGSGVRLEGLTVTGAAKGLGKGLEIVDSDVVLSEMIISGNGKGCRLLNANTQIIRSEISHNHSSSGGAGLVAEGFGSTLLLNTLVARNQGTVGGGILQNGGLLTLRHTAVLGNMGMGEGGGIYVQSHPVVEATLLLQNSIVAYTTQGSGIYVHDELSRVEALGTVVWDNAAGNFQGVPVEFRRDLGNRAIDPGFVGLWPGGDLSTEGLYLKPSSPLINAAMGDGGDPDGTRADIGLHGGLQARFAYYEDRDDDGLYDGWESLHGLKPWRRDALADEDLDGLTNLEELHYGLDPRHSDTDGDGVDDRQELAQGNDPTDPFSPSPRVHLTPGGMPLDMAILRAPATGEITLSEGIWEGRFSTLGKALVIRGEGPGRTHLSGGAMGPVLRMENGEGIETRLEHLTIRDGHGTRGGGLYLRNSSPHIHHVTLESNRGDLGGAIYSSGASPLLTELTIRNNESLGGGGGMFITGGAVTLRDALIEGNLADNGGGIAFSESGTHQLGGLTLYNNRATGDGGAISLLGETNIVAEAITVSSNRAESGGGIYVADGTLTIVNGTVVNNYGDFGGGVALQGAPQVHLDGTIIAYQRNGGGVVSAPRRGGALTLQGALFWSNNDGDLLGEALDPQPLPSEAHRGDPFFWGEPCMGAWVGDALRLGPTSAAKDGAPWLGADPDGSPRDIGAFGGEIPNTAALTDRDEDTLPDGWEALWDMDLDELDLHDDLDGDGLSNQEEYIAGLDPTRRDSDGDGVRDGDELLHGSDARSPFTVILQSTDGFRSPLESYGGAQHEGQN